MFQESFCKDIAYSEEQNAASDSLYVSAKKVVDLSAGIFGADNIEVNMLLLIWSELSSIMYILCFQFSFSSVDVTAWVCDYAPVSRMNKIIQMLDSIRGLFIFIFYITLFQTSCSSMCIGHGTYGHDVTTSQADIEENGRRISSIVTVIF